MCVIFLCEGMLGCCCGALCMGPKAYYMYTLTVMKASPTVEPTAPESGVCGLRRRVRRYTDDFNYPGHRKNKREKKMYEEKETVRGGGANE